jgi:probable rRNA maturation factor
VGSCGAEMVKLNLEYVIKDEKWRNYIEEDKLGGRIELILHHILRILKIKGNMTIELSMTLTNDKDIQKINKKFRQSNTPTNVLSFPLYEKEFFEVIKQEKYVVLGDIIVSLETLIREAGEQGITFDYHLNHLIIHSILHLIGFDHREDAEAENMEEIERIALSLL